MLTNEKIVAIEKAYYALGQMTDPPPLRPWLFSIAHNAAMDFLKRYERRKVELVSEVPEPEALDITGLTGLPCQEDPQRPHGQPSTRTSTPRSGVAGPGGSAETR